MPVEVTTSAGQLPLTGTITVTFGSQSQTVQLSQSNFGGLSSSAMAWRHSTSASPEPMRSTAPTPAMPISSPSATALNALSVTIYTNTLATTTTTLSLSATNLPANGSLTATVKVTSNGGPTPTGYITLYQDGNFVQLLQQLDSTGTVVTPVPSASVIMNGQTPFLATYGGDPYNAPSLSAPVMVTANEGDYSLTTSNALLSIASGKSGTALIAVGAPYGQRLSGSVSLTCSTSSSLIGCSLSPTSLMLPSDPDQVASSSLTITTATQSASSRPATGSGSFRGIAGGGGAVFAALLIVAVPLRSRRRLTTLLILILLLVPPAAMLTGCGGSGSHTTTTTTPPPQGVSARHIHRNCDRRIFWHHALAGSQNRGPVAYAEMAPILAGSSFTSAGQEECALPSLISMGRTVRFGSG